MAKKVSVTYEFDAGEMYHMAGLLTDRGFDVRYVARSIKRYYISDGDNLLLKTRSRRYSDKVFLDLDEEIIELIGPHVDDYIENGWDGVVNRPMKALPEISCFVRLGIPIRYPIRDIGNEKSKLARHIGYDMNDLIIDGGFNVGDIASNSYRGLGIRPSSIKTGISLIRRGKLSSLVGTLDSDRWLRRISIILDYMDVNEQHPIVEKMREWDERFVYPPE